MMNASVYLLLSFAMVAALVTTGPMQVQEAGVVRGTIRFVTIDQSPLHGATVTLEGEGTKQQVQTDKQGAYEIRVEPGTYHVSVDGPSYKKTKRAVFRVRKSMIVTIDLELVPRTIVDRIRPPDWKPAKPPIKGVVDGEEVPFKDKNFTVAGDPHELMIRYGKWDESGEVFTYEGAPVHYEMTTGEESKFLPVMVTFDFLTIYANKACYDSKTQRLTADGNVIVEDGKHRKRVQHAEVDFSARNPMSTLIAR